MVILVRKAKIGSEYIKSCPISDHCSVMKAKILQKPKYLKNAFAQTTFSYFPYFLVTTSYNPYYGTHFLQINMTKFEDSIEIEKTINGNKLQLRMMN